MKNLSYNKTVTFLGLILLLVLTYFRENFLLEINANLAMEEFDRSYSYLMSDFFKKMSPEYLKKWKWGVTIVFTGLMTIVTVLSLYSWFKSFQLLRLLGWFYLVLFMIVILLAFIGFLTNSFDDIYFVLRKFLGVVQSPLPFFTFFALFYWSTKINDNKSNHK